MELNETVLSIYPVEEAFLFWGEKTFQALYYPHLTGGGVKIDDVVQITLMSLFSKTLVVSCRPKIVHSDTVVCCWIYV